MLAILLLLSLTQLLQGAPVVYISDGQGATPVTHAIRNTTVPLGRRETSDIIVSCLVTVFACTWTAIHPNMPSPTDSRWVIFKRRVITMIYALLAPEAITAWALAQHLAARHIAYEYNRRAGQKENVGDSHSLVPRIFHWAVDWIAQIPASVRKLFRPVQLHDPDTFRKWTIAHGFFVQMGGFVLSTNGRPVQAIGCDNNGFIKDLPTLIVENHINAPTTTEAELHDRSKGDFISKTVIVLQTTWFIAQCIARWSIHLPVTQLEVVTLGFAVLNGITYALWWDKPQTVGVHIYLEWKSESIETDVLTEKGKQAARADAEATWKSFLTRKISRDFQLPSRSRIHLSLLWRVPYRLSQAILRPLGQMLLLTKTDGVPNYGDIRLPMFYSAANDNHTAYVWGISLAVASLFGCVHLIPAWFLHFPSHTEMLLWRLSAAIITGQPIIVGLIGIVSVGVWKAKPSIILSLPIFALYIIPRTTLIILAFWSLQDLPSATFDTIEWISVIPHL